MRQPSEVTDPFAPPHWRLIAAEAIFQGERSMAYYKMDQNVVAAVAHLQSQAKRISRGWVSAIDEAIGVFRDTRSQLKWEIESRIAASQSDDDISRAVSIQEDVVHFYRSLCFDVPPVATDYLMAQVIGHGPHVGFRKDQVREFWVWSAMGGGSIVLGHLLRTFRRSFRQDEEPTLAVYLRESVDPSTQAYVATAVLPRGAAWKPWFMKLHTRLIEYDGIYASKSRSLQLEFLRREVIRAGRSVLEGTAAKPPDCKAKPKRTRTVRRKPKLRETESPHAFPSFEAQIRDLARSF